MAQQSKTDLHLLTIKGKFWNKQKVISALPSSFELNDVDYLVSKTTKEAGSGAVLLFTALQLLESDPEADFQIDVYKKLRHTSQKQNATRRHKQHFRLNNISRTS